VKELQVSSSGLASTTPAATFAAATETLRSTVRWLLTAAAGVGGILVAGLQLASLGSLSLTQWRLWVAVGGVLACTAGVVLVMTRTSQILTDDWITLAQLSIGDFQARLDGAETDPGLQQEIEVYKHELYAHVAADVPQLYQRLIEANGHARTADPGGSATKDAAELRDAAENVVQFANYYETRQKFKALSRRLVCAVAAIVFGVLLFAYAANPSG
jgi:hypothetical protein